MQQLGQILTAIDTDLDIVVLVGGKCEAMAARAGDGYDRLGVTPKGGRDLLSRVIDKVVDQNHGDYRRRSILRRIWGLTEQAAPTKRAS